MDKIKAGMFLGALGAIIASIITFLNYNKGENMYFTAFIVVVILVFVVIAISIFVIYTTQINKYKDLKVDNEKMNTKCCEIISQNESLKNNIDKFTAVTEHYIVKKEQLYSHATLKIITAFLSTGLSNLSHSLDSKEIIEPIKIYCLITLKVKYIYMKKKIEVLITEPFPNEIKSASDIVDIFTKYIEDYNKISIRFGVSPDFLNKFNTIHAKSIETSAFMIMSLVTIANINENSGGIIRQILDCLIPAFKDAPAEAVQTCFTNSGFAEKCQIYYEENNNKIIRLDHINEDNVTL